MTTKPHAGYRHEALLYRDDSEYSAGAVDFVAEAVALGQPAMVAVPAGRLDAVRAGLRERVGADAPGVHLLDMARVGHNPARIIPAWQQFLDRYEGRPVRGVGEPVWAGRRSVEIDECRLHEALLGIAVPPDTPLWLRCPYDVSALGEPVVDSALRSHATYVERGRLVGSRVYGGVLELHEIFGGDLDEPDAPAELMDFADGDLARVRRSVEAHAIAAGLGSERVGDVVLAVTELATNSLRHGGGRGTLRTWRDPDALVYEVRDAGRIGDLLVGRRAPRTSDEGGRGVWMANQLCDLVQVRSGDSGTVVRTYTWL